MPLPSDAPELSDLDLLLSVARLGSVGKAARAHGISQPAASARMSLLERQLGLRLLERSPTGSRLTPAGQAVAQWAREVVEAATGLLAGVAALRNAEHGLLRVAASMTVAEYLMPTWLVTLRAKLPKVTVALQAMNSREVAARVVEDLADLGFVEDPDPHPELREHVVARDELVVVVAPDHPWARRSAPVSLDELAAERLVLRERGSGTRETLRRVLGELHDEVPHLELASTTAIKEAVVAGAGVSVLSVLAVERELRAGQLVRVPVAGADLRRTIRAVWKGRPLAPAVRALLDVATARPVPADGPVARAASEPGSPRSGGALPASGSASPRSQP